MAFYVVGPGGTATGDAGRHAIQPTGTLAAFGVANYYPSGDDPWAATTPPIDNDVIIVAKTQNEVLTSASSWGDAPTVNEEIQVFSVDELALDQQANGAQFSWNNPLDLTLNGSITLFGITVSIGDDMLIPTSSRVLFIDSNIILSGGGDTITLNGAGTCLHLINSDITNVASSNNSSVALTNGSFMWQGGSVVNAGADIINLIRGSQNGTLGVILENVDCRAVSGFIFASFGQVIEDDNLSFRMSGCAMSNTAGFLEEDLGKTCQEMDVGDCSPDTANAYSQVFSASRGGRMQNDSVIFRQEDTAFFDSNKISLKVTTNAFSTRTRPFRIYFPNAFLPLSSPSTDTIRFRFVSTTVLTNADVWADVYCKDATTPFVYNTFSSRVGDILSTGTTYSDDSGNSDWRDGGGPLVGFNEYFMDIDTSSNPCGNSVPDIKMYISIPSTTVYFSPVIEAI